MNFCTKNNRVLIFLLFLASSFFAQTYAQQFTYQFQTEVAHNDQRGRLLSPAITLFAHKQFNHLNSSILFEPSFLKDTQKTREYHLRVQYQKSRQGQLISFQAEDGVTIHATYFNRNSNKLLIVGEGFTNEREVMSPFIDMFPDYDLVLFDFRGQGLDTRTFSLSKQCIGVDTKYARLGVVEERDVFAVVDGMKKIKKYTHIYGLGVCYSAFIFLKAAALRQGLFDKLILDGCWVSVPLIIEKFRTDLKLILDPQRGGWKEHWLFGDKTVQDILMWISINIFGFPLNEISLLNYLESVKNIPLLFFYGKDDLMVYRNEFESVWNGIKNTSKTAIITSNPHVRNHLKQKELYRLLCELFLNHDHEYFKELIADQKAEKIAQLYSKQVLNFIV